MRKIKISPCIETVEWYGDRTMDILTASDGNNELVLYCYNHGNGYIKIFTLLRDFLAYQYDSRLIQGDGVLDIELDLYNSDEEFDRFISENFKEMWQTANPFSKFTE